MINLNVVKLQTKNESDAKIILELTAFRDETSYQLKLAHEQQEHYQLKSCRRTNHGT